MAHLAFKGWMAAHQIRQQEIAELLGISYTAVNGKLNGRHSFTLEQVSKICEKYHISADLFLPEELRKANTEVQV